MAFTSAYWPATYFPPTYWPRGSDPALLSLDFLAAVQRAVLAAIPKAVLRGFWEGTVPIGTPPPYAQLLDGGVDPQVRREGAYVRQTFRIGLYGRSEEEVADLARRVRDVLKGRVEYFRGGQTIGSIRRETSGPRIDLKGTGTGGGNVWQRIDTYGADLIYGD
jgi:hypothetical protein